MCMRSVIAFVLALLVIGCGGGSDPPVQLAADPSPQYPNPSTVLPTGESFVPDGSNCPASSDYIRIGTLGPHTITYSNAATGITGHVSDQLWVCNSEDGRTMHWSSDPIVLKHGDNAVTFLMVAGSRQSSATVTYKGPT